MMNGESIQLTTSDGPFTLSAVPTRHICSPTSGSVRHGRLWSTRDAVPDGRRIAAAGYVVALPDLYLPRRLDPRSGAGRGARDVPSLLPLLFSDQELRSRFRDRYFASATNPDHVRTDLSATSTICAVARMFAPGQPVSSATAWGDIARFERRPSSAPSLAPSPASMEAIS